MESCNGPWWQGEAGRGVDGVRRRGAGASRAARPDQARHKRVGLGVWGRRGCDVSGAPSISHWPWRHAWGHAWPWRCAHVEPRVPARAGAMECTWPMSEG